MRSAADELADRVRDERRATELWTRAAAAAEAGGAAAAVSYVAAALHEGLGPAAVRAGLAECAQSFGTATLPGTVARALRSFPALLHDVAEPVLVAVTMAVGLGEDDAVAEADGLAASFGLEDLLAALACTSAALADQVAQGLKHDDAEAFWPRRRLFRS